MKDLFKIFEKDYMHEDFTRREWIIYGIAYPLSMIVLCIIAGMI